MREPRNCGDCGAAPGAYHEAGCDVERCARCGGQAFACPCIYEVCGIDYDTMEETHPDIYNDGPTDEMCERWEREWGARRLRWSGEYPGVAECREYGFWCVGPPWKSVPAGTPGAVEDLNRLRRECRWDVEKQKMVPER